MQASQESVYGNRQGRATFGAVATARTASERAFEYWGFEAVVCSSSTPMLDWLEEFLKPWFTVGPAPAHTSAPVIDVRIDAEMFRS